MTILALVGTQWGDEGKGKVCDLLAGEADLVVRFSGGNNAGHTIVTEKGMMILHIVPSGALRKGVHNLIGAGTVIDPAVLRKELDALEEIGLPQGATTLTVSPKAHIITDIHRAYEAWIEEQLGDYKIGTTLRGIGPAYALKALRLNLRTGELRSEETVRTRIALLAKMLQATEEDAEKVTEYLLGIREWFLPLLGDDIKLVREAQASGKNILLEGAQGALLDIDHGTYPFVTSSGTTTATACTGLGIPPSAITTSIGVLKAYCTRVGEGPFPTELSGEMGDLLRERGGEYGATTRRPRRCGWFDGVAACYTIAINGLDSLAVTKLDVLDGLEQIMLCTAYELDGRKIEHFPTEAEALSNVKPIYEEMPGWKGNTTEARYYEELPEGAKRYLKRIEEITGVKIALISVGSHRDETILIDNPWI